MMHVHVAFSLMCNLNQHNRRVWWYDGSIECYAGFQVAAIGAVCVLSLAPFAVAGLMWRWREDVALSRPLRAIWHVLGMGYREGCR